jgi:hypothetical protein
MEHTRVWLREDASGARAGAAQGDTGMFITDEGRVNRFARRYGNLAVGCVPCPLRESTAHLHRRWRTHV